MNWLEVGILFALILINGFFAASELALVSARKAGLRAAAERGERGAAVALTLLENPTRLLSSIQIGITLVGILTGVYSGAVFAEHLAGLLAQWPWMQPYAHEVAFTTVVVIITYLSLIFGELVPKRFALAHAEKLATFVAIPMLWVAKLGAPLVWILQVSTEAVAKLLPMRTAPQESLIEDELRSLLSTGAKEGVLHRREKELIEGVLRLADRSVESVMVPRGQVIWLDVNDSPERLWAEARASGHARFLLCEGELDRLLGVITLADLGEVLRNGRLDRELHIRPPLHIPTSVSLLRLLELFQSSSTHLAIVTDEYGDIKGVITPADILKSIAGELPDMGSRERAEVVERDDGSLLIDGHMPIDHLEARLERNDLAKGDDYHTVAGFMLWHLGRVPVTGESLIWRDLKLEVVDMDSQRIDKILLTRKLNADPDDSG